MHGDVGGEKGKDEGRRMKEEEGKKGEEKRGGSHSLAV
jgi:hypothetical protein